MLVALSAIALAGCFGQGIRRVGNPLTAEQMPPGLWRSLGGNDCTWSRIRSGTPNNAGSSTHTSGPHYAQIEASDIGFAIGNCLPFWQHPGPYAAPLVQPGNPFGDGDYLVGYEVAPGTYVASPPAGQTCRWAVVKGFHGLDASGRDPDFVRGASTTAAAPVAVIEPGNFGFTSQGCGQWQSTGPLPPAPGGAAAAGLEIEGVVEDFADPSVLRVDDPGAVRRIRPVLLRVLDRVRLPGAGHGTGRALHRPSDLGMGGDRLHRTCGRPRRRCRP